MNNPSRIGPQTEKISVCALYGAQEYHQVLALRFGLGQCVEIRFLARDRFCVDRIGMQADGNIVYFAPHGGVGWLEEELMAVDPVTLEAIRTIKEDLYEHQARHILDTA